MIRDIIETPEFRNSFKRKADIFRRTQKTRGEVFIPEQILNDIELFKSEYISALRHEKRDDWRRYVNILWLGGSCVSEAKRKIYGVYRVIRERNPSSSPLTFV